MIPHFLLLFLLLGLAGCLRDAPSPPRFAPGEPLYEQYTSNGPRILVESTREESWKLRHRRGHLRVYSPSMAPLGRVETIEENQVLIRGLNGAILHRSARISDDVAELSTVWRPERADGGWDLFDPQGRLLAILRRDADEPWTLASTYARRETFQVQREGRRAQVISSEGAIPLELTLPSKIASHWSDLKILAISIDSLPLLERTALGLWLHHHLAGAADDEPELLPPPDPSDLPSTSDALPPQDLRSPDSLSPD